MTGSPYDASRARAGKGFKVPVLVPYEEDDQIELAKWIDTRGVLWCHPPMGGVRHKATAVKLNRMGAKAGVPDVLIFTPPPHYPDAVGTALELKRLNGGRVSAEQREWHRRLRDCGWIVVVAKGLHAGIQALEDLGY